MKYKIKIPKSFKLFATTIIINYDDLRLSNESYLGDSSFTNSSITLCENYKGKEVNKDVIIDTFYHEKVHVILDAMGEHKLSRKEKFTEVFARLLRQSDESAEFKQALNNKD